MFWRITALFIGLLLSAAALGQEQTAPGPDPAPAAPQPASAQPTTPSGDPASASRSPSSPPSAKKAVPRRKHKRVVREGGASETEARLAPGMPDEQASHQRQSTSELLSSADQHLRLLDGRALSTEKEAIVEQVRQFSAQAATALAAGDLVRARNLALKAHLLSDDLVRR